MFPLKIKRLIRGAKEHVAAGLGAAADYIANYDLFYSPFDGTVEAYYGTEGGNWLRLTRDNGDKIEFAHLSDYSVRSGKVIKGQPLGLTGNTGTITTGPHLHIQIFNSKGQRLDPETYQWEMYTYKVYVLKKNLPSLDPVFKIVNDYFAKVTNNEFSLNIEVTDTDFPFTLINSTGVSGTTYQTIDIFIVDLQQIRRVAGNNLPTVLFFNRLDYNISPTHPVNSGDISQILSEPNANPEVLAETFVHELLHGWYIKLKLPDDVHTHSGLYDPRPNANYSDIILKLKPRWAELVNKPMNQAKIVKSKSTNTVFVCYPIPSEEYLKEKCSLEGIEVPTSIPDTDSLK